MPLSLFFVAAKINATDYGDLSDGGSVSSASIGAISLGGYLADTCAFDIRDFVAGTSGYGSSDVFAPALNDLSEFDGVVGNDGSIVATGGVLSVDSGSSDHYGYKAITPITGTLYFQFQLRVRSGDGTPDYADVWEDAATAAADVPNTALDGIFKGVSVWRWDGPGLDFGAGPSGGPNWDTVNLKFSYDAPPPPVAAFHIAS